MSTVLFQRRTRRISPEPGIGKGSADRGVAQPLLDRVQVDPALAHVRADGSAKIVDAQISQLGPLEDQPPGFRQVRDRPRLAGSLAQPWKNEGRSLGPRDSLEDGHR